MKAVTLLVALAAAQSDACTTLLVGKKASADGSVMATHSDDGEGQGDPRLIRVPAMDHPEGSQRPIFFAPEIYPRYVGYDRKIPDYYPVDNQTAMEPIGFIPQVPHTYAYVEQTYGALNEHQLGIGESTCSGNFGAAPIGQGGVALMSVDAMTRVAMERCKSSRCAVQLMGDLAVKYGFYGAGSFEGTAESLMVIDPNEGFVFHVLPNSNVGGSAIWAAARVPDDHVTVVANMFTIREVNLTDSDNFLGSANMHPIAEAKGWWQESDGLLDFTKVFSNGEYAHKYYSGRRMWGAFRKFAPSLTDVAKPRIPAEYKDLRYAKPYPFSVKPDELQAPRHLMSIHREWYAGTKYAPTKAGNIAGGAWATPIRYNLLPAQQNKTLGGAPGNWERTINIYRTTDSFVVQARGWLPNAIGGTIWYGPHAAYGTCYVPFTLGMSSLPDSYTHGHPGALDKSTAFWAHRYTANLVNLRFSSMMGNEVVPLQQAFEAKAVELQAAVDSSYAALAKAGSPASALAELLTTSYSAHAAEVVAAWSALPDKLIFKYADGWLNEPGKPGQLEGYPTWFLKEARSYVNGPPSVYHKLP